MSEASSYKDFSGTIGGLRTDASGWRHRWRFGSPSHLVESRSNRVANQEAIDEQLDRLEERFGSFSVETETVTNEPEFFEQGRQLAEDGWLGDAGAWVEDTDERVLLIRHAGAAEQWGGTRRWPRTW